MSHRSAPLARTLAAATALLGLVGAPRHARAQGDLEKTPWATSMVYPVGDPLDYQKPAPGDDRGFLLSRGVQRGRKRDRHDGLDLANRESGAEVRAVAPGLVVCTKDHARGWGNMVVLAHRMPGGDVLFSLFAHMLPGSITVREGQIVALGQPLGKVGRTGHATGPHLHLEFRTLTSSLEAIKEPLAMAWERAAIVDPLRIFATMRSHEGGFGSPHGIASAVGTALPPPPAPDADAFEDVLARAVGRGALPATALRHGDEALTRGELYRLAWAEIAPTGAAIPNRWSKLRAQITARAVALPQAARPAFAARALPRRTSDAEHPASLSELRDVCAALALVRAARPDLARPVGGPSRDVLRLAFPQGLAALAADDRPADAPPLPMNAIGPPAVTRRQACLLLAYEQAGGDAAAPPAAALDGNAR